MAEIGDLPIECDRYAPYQEKAIDLEKGDLPSSLTETGDNPSCTVSSDLTSYSDRDWRLTEWH